MASRSLSSKVSAQKTLLDAARGLLLPGGGGHRRILRCFPLAERHVWNPSASDSTGTPAAFHEALCRKIRAARDRVCLASLYIGPAADCDPTASIREQELLDALEATSARSVQILLDQNRALRTVPVTGKSAEEGETSITSAEACLRVLDRRRQNKIRDSSTNENDEQHGSADGIFLLSVLPDYQQKLLKNPLNEVAGVFHLKCYIMDHEMVITGANLSEEYFKDRTDRYLWITSGDEHGESEASPARKSHPLVECYANMVQALSQHAEPYKPFPGSSSPRRTTRQELLDSLTEILTEDSNGENRIDEEFHDEDVVAYAVPTLQTPPSFFRGYRNPIPADTDVTASLIEQSAASLENGCIYMASAYLNPTDQLRRAITSDSRVTHMLTAGLASHGFKPKNKPGNKGKAWIPAVYDTLGRRITQSPKDGTQLWYYVRPGWTFHCKGLWLTAMAAGRSVQEESMATAKTTCESSTLSAVIAGSGNFGYRSAVRDMESNVILVFTRQKSEIQMSFLSEWNVLFKHAQSANRATPLVLQWPFRLLLPVIRYFF